MKRGRQDLIVPIRDRRQRRRILTLKNFRNAALVLVAIYVGIMIEEHFRAPKNTTEYGRLSRVESATAVARKPDVIREGAPIPDANSADPMLVAPAAREQLLRADSNVPTATVTTAQVIAVPEPLPGRDAAGHLVVVGGPEGVTIVQKRGGRPVLGGGFGKQ